jgi:hypothetical protein
MASSDPPTLLTLRSRQITHYKTALRHAEAQLHALQTAISSLKSTLTEVRSEEAFWKARVQELDRLNRIQTLQLAATSRGKREAEQECARLRVELQEMRRAAGKGWVEKTVQTDDKDWTETVTLGGIMRMAASRGDFAVREREHVRPDGNRDRRTTLRARLQATRERIERMKGGRRVLDGLIAERAEEG